MSETPTVIAAPVWVTGQLLRTADGSEYPVTVQPPEEIWAIFVRVDDHYEIAATMPTQERAEAAARALAEQLPRVHLPTGGRLQ